MSQSPATRPSRLNGRVAVLSPHLDDGVLSLGAAIAEASSGGAEVRIVTVFAYDPQANGSAGAWDAACGFHSAAEAAQARRAEDAESCARVGAEPVWLPFADEEYGEPVGDDELWAAIEPRLTGADAVLVPGFPLAVGDHQRVSRLVLERLPHSMTVGLYVEQPYASWRLMSFGGRAGAPGMSPRRGVGNTVRLALAPGSRPASQRPSVPASLGALVPEPVHWDAVPHGARAGVAKRRAIRAHRSQVRGFGPLVLTRIWVYERAWGGEAVAWLSAGPRRSAAGRTP
jgi:LmbE family N-acetylglucosaminyl deacetylase